jgi:hypothetical protein
MARIIPIVWGFPGMGFAGALILFGWAAEIRLMQTIHEGVKNNKY